MENDLDSDYSDANAMDERGFSTMENITNPMQLVIQSMDENEQDRLSNITLLFWTKAIP